VTLNEEPWPADLPPMPALDTVADGSSVGARWQIRAGGTSEHYLTLLDIELADGRRTGGGGHGGPALLPGQVMSFSVHRSDQAAHYLVGRVHPSVARVHLDLTRGPEGGLDARPMGHDTRIGVAFVAAILPEHADVVSVTAWDSSGRRLQARDTRGYRAFFGQTRDSRTDQQTDHHFGEPPTPE
jgi:hypothetical protein